MLSHRASCAKLGKPCRESCGACAQAPAFEYELRLEGKTGYYEARASRSGADEAVVLVRDVSERKRVELALERSEACCSAARDKPAFSRARITSAVIAAINVVASAALGQIGTLIGFVVGVVVIKQAYQLAVWRVLLIMVFNAIIVGLLGGFIGSMRF